MRVVFAADHAGFELKEHLKPLVASLGHDVADVGAVSFEPTDDYPDYCALAARDVSGDPEGTRAIILGGSGQGEAIVANRFPCVRAIVFNGAPAATREPDVLDEIALSREHNNANVLSLGARFLTDDEAERAVSTWLSTPFRGAERHLRRIKKIETYPDGA